MNDTEEIFNMNEQKGLLKQKFASLTDDNQLLEEGINDERIGKHQVRLGRTKDEIDKIISSLKF